MTDAAFGQRREPNQNPVYFLHWILIAKSNLRRNSTQLSWLWATTHWRH